MIKRLTGTDRKDSFLELLLDETLCAGKILVPETWVREAGGLNPKLNAKKKYELLLRIAEKHGFATEEIEYTPQEDEIVLDEPVGTPEESLKTDCYIVSRYIQVLQETGYFEAAVASILEQSKICGCENSIIAWLEQMIGRTGYFEILEEAVSPVLIYKGSDICNNMLNIFAEQFGSALEQKGIRVEYFDEQKEPLENLTRYIGRYFKAVFGVQTYLFQVKMADGVTYLHEKIKGPKLHLILDHPIWMKQQLEHEYPDFFVLSHDRNYVKFIQKYYKKKAVHFPIPGMENDSTEHKKIYDLTFVGSMGDYRQQMHHIREMQRQDQFLANRFLLIMRKNKDLSAEIAFEKAFALYRDRYAGEEPVEVFYRMRRVIYLVMDYYRYQILKTILDYGIKLDVFGDFWKSSVFADYPNLICHSGVTVEESLEVYARSKVSLNIMSWHKDGFTERVANIMLAHTVLLTDKTTYLEENYVNGKELVMFSLDEIEKLSELIKRVSGQGQLEQIAEAGYQKTLKRHTWEYQTEELLKALDEIRE